MRLIINGQPHNRAAPLDKLSRAVVISLFSWRKQASDDVTDIENGWWGDSYPTVQNDRIGSRLYLLQRQKLSNATAILARGYIEQALQWMKEDGVVERIDVTVKRQGLDALVANVVLHQASGTHHIDFNDLWREIHDR